MYLKNILSISKSYKSMILKRIHVCYPCYWCEHKSKGAKLHSKETRNTCYYNCNSFCSVNRVSTPGYFIVENYFFTMLSMRPRRENLIFYYCISRLLKPRSKVILLLSTVFQTMQICFWRIKTCQNYVHFMFIRICSGNNKIAIVPFVKYFNMFLLL